MCIQYILIKLSNFEVMSSPSFPGPPLVMKMIGFRVTISSALTPLLFSLKKDLD